MADLTGWAATIVMAMGSIGVAHKRVWGLGLLLLGNVGWGVVGVLSGLYSLIAVLVFMAALDSYGIYQWSK